MADTTGLTGALSLRLGDLKQRRSGHDLGHVFRDLAVMLADGGDCLADIAALGDQGVLVGELAADSIYVTMTPGELDQHMRVLTGRHPRHPERGSASRLSHGLRRRRPVRLLSP